MQLARIVGTVVATRKDAGLHGLKLLLMQPLAADGRAAGRSIVGVDSVGAGVGETVFFVRGREASFPFLPRLAPTDAAVVASVDYWSVDDSAAGAGGTF